MLVYWARLMGFVVVLVILTACGMAPAAGHESIPVHPLTTQAIGSRSTEIAIHPAVGATALPHDRVTKTPGHVGQPPAMEESANGIEPSTETPDAILIPQSDTPIMPACSPLAGHSIQELLEIISAPYDPPPPGKEERHHGVDFAYYRRGERESILGVEVQAVLPGRVAMSLADSFPYGNVVIIETPGEYLPVNLITSLEMSKGESLYILYAHLGQPPLVTAGEQVDICQLLGYVGKSGNAGVAHLHLEARLGPPGISFTGMAYYSTRVTPVEKGNYERWRTSGDFRHFDPLRLYFFSEGETPDGSER